MLNTKMALPVSKSLTTRTKKYFKCLKINVLTQGSATFGPWPTRVAPWWAGPVYLPAASAGLPLQANEGCRKRRRPRDVLASFVSPISLFSPPTQKYKEIAEIFIEHFCLFFALLLITLSI